MLLVHTNTSTYTSHKKNTNTCSFLIYDEEDFLRAKSCKIEIIIIF